MTINDRPRYKIEHATVMYPECWWALIRLTWPFTISKPMTSWLMIKTPEKAPNTIKKSFIDPLIGNLAVAKVTFRAACLAIQ